MFDMKFSIDGFDRKWANGRRWQIKWNLLPCSVVQLRVHQIFDVQLKQWTFNWNSVDRSNFLHSLVRSRLFNRSWFQIVWNSSKIQTLIFHHSCRNQFPTLNTSRKNSAKGEVWSVVKRKNNNGKSNSIIATFKAFFASPWNGRRVISLLGWFLCCLITRQTKQKQEVSKFISIDDWKLDSNKRCIVKKRFRWF